MRRGVTGWFKRRKVTLRRQVGWVRLALSEDGVARCAANKGDWGGRKKEIWRMGGSETRFLEAR